MAGPRYVQSGALPLTAAGGNSGLQTLVSPDDNLDRRLTGIFVTDFTALIHSQVFNAQARVADVQHVLFTLRVMFLELNEVYKSGINFQFLVLNDSAGAVPAAKFILLRYEVGT